MTYITQAGNIGFGDVSFRLNYLAATSEKGFSVIGFDNDKDKIKNKKNASLSEQIVEFDKQEF